MQAHTWKCMAGDCGHKVEKCFLTGGPRNGSHCSERLLQSPDLGSYNELTWIKPKTIFSGVIVGSAWSRDLMKSL